MGLRSCASTDGVTVFSDQADTSVAGVKIGPADTAEYDAEMNFVSRTDGLFVQISGFGDGSSSNHSWIDRYEVRVESSSTYGRSWTDVGLVSGVVLRGVSLANGVHVVEVRAIDKALQPSDVITTNVTVDTVQPTPTGKRMCRSCIIVNSQNAHRHPSQVHSLHAF